MAMSYFMRLDGQLFGIHYGYNPGRPASHGCIRSDRWRLLKLFTARLRPEPGLKSSKEKGQLQALTGGSGKPPEGV